MDIRRETRAGGSIVFIGGKLDTLAAAELEKAIAEGMSASSHRVVVDCADLLYICSAGLRVLLLGSRECQKEGGFLRLSAVSNFILEVFSITGFDKLFRVYENPERALEAE